MICQHGRGSELTSSFQHEDDREGLDCALEESVARGLDSLFAEEVSAELDATN